MVRDKKKSIDDEISRIRILARSEYPYLYGLVKGVNITLVEGEMLAYTDGRVVCMSEDILRNRSINKYIYLHEILHIGLLHTIRAQLYKGVNMKAYNLLADHRVNSYLNEKNKRIEGSVYDLREYGFDKFLSDDEMDNYKQYDIDYLYSKIRNQIEKLKQNNKFEGYSGDITDSQDRENKEGEGQGEGKNNNSDNSTNNKGISKALTEQEIKEMLSQGVVYGRSIGATKGGLEEYIENYCNKIVDWNKVVMNNAHMLFERENDYSRLHKKSYLRDYSIMPKKRRKEGVKIMVGIDTSGSMDLSSISLFLGSLINLVKTYDAELEIMEVDTDKQMIFRVNSRRDLDKVKISGRGGTSFKPFVEHIKDNNVKLAVVFTDGYGDQSNLDYKGYCKLFWIISKGGNKEGFRFGKILEMRK